MTTTLDALQVEDRSRATSATCSVVDCGLDPRARGLCSKHYQRWRKTGDPVGLLNTPVDLAERFWAKVDTSGHCWVWTAGTNEHGYGRIQVGGRRGPGVELAHRVAWKLATGIEPGELCVLHVCDTPPCVRPDHLVLGSQIANIRDMVSKGRQKGQRR